jgi:hypothetical protein
VAQEEEGATEVVSIRLKEVPIETKHSKFLVEHMRIRTMRPNIRRKFRRLGESKGGKKKVRKMVLNANMVQHADSNKEANVTINILKLKR